MLPADVREMLAYIRPHRESGDPFDVVIGGETRGPDDLASVQPYIDAGATWWLQDVSPWAFGWTGQGIWPVAAMCERVRSGPPRTA